MDKTYTREFVSGMVAYGLMVVVMVIAVPMMGDSPWRYLLALLPVLPAAYVLRAYIRFLGRLDELQQRIQLSAIAFAAGTTGMLTFAYGFLELAGFPHIPAIWVFPVLIWLWGIGLAIASRRYS